MDDKVDTCPLLHSAERGEEQNERGEVLVCSCLVEKVGGKGVRYWCVDRGVRRRGPDCGIFGSV